MILLLSKRFTDLSKKKLLKLDNLQMDEGKIWDQVIKWGIAQNSNLNPNPTQWSDEDFLTLKTTLKNCLPHIRYFQIPNEDIMEKVLPYQRILEPNLWKDILSRSMTPNKPITSTILPPRNI